MMEAKDCGDLGTFSGLGEHQGMGDGDDVEVHLQKVPPTVLVSVQESAGKAGAP